jgi:ubiquinone/menaquinone biosynthesis C-methylase UbiE
MHPERKELSPEGVSEPESYYFELQAHIGATKHGGGLKATRELIELCHIDKDEYVLDIGCGVGATPCYIAKKHGCRAVGVDISEGMIDRSNGRAKREGLENRVEFRVADAQNLPFQDTLFDVVISESVTAFVEDKQRAVSEYVRVTKPGGYVGFNESIWIKAPPPKELVEWASRTYGAKTEFLTSNGWEELLKGLGLREMVMRTYKITPLSQWINEVRGVDLRDFTRGWGWFFSQFIGNPGYRRFMKEALTTPRNIFEYLGYGLYAGRE